jgi:hypothetical protein
MEPFRDRNRARAVNAAAAMPTITTGIAFDLTISSPRLASKDPPSPFAERAVRLCGESLHATNGCLLEGLFGVGHEPAWTQTRLNGVDCLAHLQTR